MPLLFYYVTLKEDPFRKGGGGGGRGWEGVGGDGREWVLDAYIYANEQ